MCLTFAVYNFSLVCYNAAQFIVACLLVDGLKYGDKPEVFVKSPRGVIVARDRDTAGQPVFRH